MVSELIQDLDRNFGPNKRFHFTKVTFISKKESFRETLQSVSSIRTQGLILTFGTYFRGKPRGKRFGQYDSIRNFSMQRTENHCLSRVPLSFQAMAFQYFWFIELNPVSLDSSWNTDWFIDQLQSAEVRTPCFQLETGSFIDHNMNLFNIPKNFLLKLKHIRRARFHTCLETNLLLTCNCYSRFKVSRVSLRACRPLTELAERVLRIPPQQHFRFFWFTLTWILSLETDCDMLCYF